jgi:hypothetical protein
LRTKASNYLEGMKDLPLWMRFSLEWMRSSLVMDEI